MARLGLEKAVKSYENINRKRNRGTATVKLCMLIELLRSDRTGKYLALIACRMGTTKFKGHDLEPD